MPRHGEPQKRRKTKHVSSAKPKAPLPPKAPPTSTPLPTPAPPPPPSADLPSGALPAYVVRLGQRKRFEHVVPCAACPLARPGKPINRAVRSLSTRSRHQPHCKARVCVKAARGTGGGLVLGPAAHTMPLSAAAVEAQAAAEGLTSSLDELRVDTTTPEGMEHASGFRGVHPKADSSDRSGRPRLKYSASYRSIHEGSGDARGRIHVGTFPTAAQAALALARAKATEAAEAAAVPARVPASEAEVLAQRLVAELCVRVSEAGLKAIRALLLMRDEPELLRDEAFARTDARFSSYYQYRDYLEKLGVYVWERRRSSGARQKRNADGKFNGRWRRPHDPQRHTAQ